jgi:hypothetical protein
MGPRAEHVVAILRGQGPQTGRALRERLAALGHPMDVARFYHFMAGLEDAGAVHGRFEPVTIDGVTAKVRTYAAGAA